MSVADVTEHVIQQAAECRVTEAGGQAADARDAAEYRQLKLGQQQVQEVEAQRAAGAHHRCQKFKTYG